MLIGAHMSIAGGVHEAVGRGTAEDLDCEVIQIFTRNPRGYAADPFTDEEVDAWRKAYDGSGLGATLVHAMYLINLAEPDQGKWKRAVSQLVMDLERAEALGIPWVVFHPGSHKGSGVEAGLARVAEGLDAALARTEGMDVMPLIETMPGAGTQVARSFEQIAAILDQVDQDERVGVCFDTCHTFTSGYPIHEEAGYASTFEGFDDALGLDRLKCFHLNDAVNPFESHKDGHDEIGEGHIGEGAFHRLMNDPRFADTPGYLETSEDTYATDLATLRRLRDG